MNVTLMARPDTGSLPRGYLLFRPRSATTVPASGLWMGAPFGAEFGMVVFTATRGTLNPRTCSVMGVRSGPYFREPLDLFAMDFLLTI